jgi:hypothetical protein
MLRRPQAETFLDVDFNSNMVALPVSLTGVGATFSRGSTRYRREGNLLVAKGNNVFFTELDPVTGKYGYTPEPAATNYLLRCQDINFPWTYTNMNSASSSIDTPLSATGTAVYLNSFPGTCFISQPASIVNSNAVFSFYYRHVNHANWAMRFLNSTLVGVTQWFNSSTNTLGSSSTTGGPTFISSKIERFGTSPWYRIELVCAPGTTAVVMRIHPVDADNSLTNTGAARNLYVWDTQLENGNAATSLMFTVGSTVSRSADVLSVPSVPYFNPNKMMLQINARKKAVIADTFDALYLNDGTNANQAGIRYNDGDKALVRINSTDIVGAVNLTTAEHKFATSLQGFNKLRSQNGITLAVDTSSDMPSVVNSLNIGHNLGLRQPPIYMYGFKYITNTRNQAQLNALTT